MKQHWEKLNQKQHLFKYGSVKNNQVQLIKCTYQWDFNTL